MVENITNEGWYSEKYYFNIYTINVRISIPKIPVSNPVTTKIFLSNANC